MKELDSITMIIGLLIVMTVVIFAVGLASDMYWEAWANECPCELEECPWHNH